MEENPNGRIKHWWAGIIYYITQLSVPISNTENIKNSFQENSEDN